MNAASAGVKRLLPKSLLGQMILLMGAALLVAQAVNFAFLLNRQQTLSLAQNEGPAIARFVQAASQVAAGAAPDQRQGGRRGRRMITIDITGASRVDAMRLARDPRLEQRLAGALSEGGIAFRQVRAARTPDQSRFGDGHERRRAGRWQVILLSAQLPDERWLDGRLLAPRPDPWLIGRLLLATLALYVLVLGAMLWIAARIARPLGDLTRAAENFHGRSDVAPVLPRGPSDVRRALEAFNAMNRRVGSLLDEKDRMLGAIGHDLRTPLASIRIRAEGMAPDEEREALIRTVGEMADMLEDILVLARTGRAREPARLVDLAALADAIVEEAKALGGDVSFEDSPRLAAEIQPNLLRRAIRNLIDNALAYGGKARVRVVARKGGASIEIEDDGPGIPPDRLEAVLRPFERLEGSRNRETGGAGLGLAIVKAVAEAHGGELVLENKPQGGLLARLTVPAVG